MDALFLEFADDLDNLTGESSLVGDNSGSSSQPPATPTLKRCAQSRLLELERYVAANGRILMTIALGSLSIRCSVPLKSFEATVTESNAGTLIPAYPEDLGWGPKPKTRKTSASSSSTSFSQFIEKEIQLQAKLDQALKQIQEQTRNHQALVSEVEQMRKLIQDMTRAQQGPPHDS
ncbi:CACTA en-spm transposon protein [Cucumis melo var. makuwa]|uniref:CACTA en-spm transposon protein n=1 Tax=Cucumis melo var. makuwa TaxID=1194695 RepID=A0A5D3BKZ9_CUCMM|nr:CACTA en-spm transposon protein [Cucumis melo var. makuwa]